MKRAGEEKDRGERKAKRGGGGEERRKEGDGEE